MHLEAEGLKNIYHLHMWLLRLLLVIVVYKKINQEKQVADTEKEAEHVGCCHYM